jgi:hypothetical protein
VTVAATLRKDNYRDEFKAPLLETRGIDMSQKTPLYEKRVEWGTPRRYRVCAALAFWTALTESPRLRRLGLHVDRVYSFVPLV